MLIQKDAKPGRSPSCRGKFESFVNSERCKTRSTYKIQDMRLRALLIQKDAKRARLLGAPPKGLRALLIQKDAKHLRFVPQWQYV